MSHVTHVNQSCYLDRRTHAHTHTHTRTYPAEEQKWPIGKPSIIGHVARVRMRHGIEMSHVSAHVHTAQKMMVRGFETP